MIDDGPRESYGNLPALVVRAIVIAAVWIALALASTVVASSFVHAQQQARAAQRVTLALSTDTTIALMPNPVLTPGLRMTSDTSRICRPGYSAAARNVPYQERKAVLIRYGYDWHMKGIEVDHLIPVSIGGSNKLANLWPQPYAAAMGASQKDTVEQWLRNRVCRWRSISIDSAQAQIARDWRPFYAQYHHLAPAEQRRQLVWHPGFMRGGASR